MHIVVIMQTVMKSNIYIAEIYEAPLLFFRAFTRAKVNRCEHHRYAIILNDVQQFVSQLWKINGSGTQVDFSSWTRFLGLQGGSRFVKSGALCSIYKIVLLAVF